VCVCLCVCACVCVCEWVWCVCVCGVCVCGVHVCVCVHIFGVCMCLNVVCVCEWCMCMCVCVCDLSNFWTHWATVYKIWFEYYCNLLHSKLEIFKFLQSVTNIPYEQTLRLVTISAKFTLLKFSVKYMELFKGDIFVKGKVKNSYFARF
jgi:hypothetical protein